MYDLENPIEPDVIFDLPKSLQSNTMDAITIFLNSAFEIVEGIKSMETVSVLILTLICKMLVKFPYIRYVRSLWKQAFKFESIFFNFTLGVVMGPVAARVFGSLG